MRRKRPSRTADGADGREVYLEFIAQGASVKVSAVDAATGTEVAIVGPSSATPAELEATALAKLRYVMQKRDDGL